MTQARVRELTTSSIALVMEERTSPPKISEATLRSILRPPFGIGPLVTGESIISSSRDQIDVLLSPTKINVRDLSGATKFVDSKVPGTLHKVFEWYQTTLRSYGVNFAVTVAIDDPEVWIRDNLLNQGLSEKTKKELLRGRAHISLSAGPKVWNIDFQRNAEGKLEINFNASEVATELPPIESLRKQLEEQYLGFEDMMKNLGL